MKLSLPSRQPTSWSVTMTCFRPRARTPRQYALSFSRSGSAPCARHTPVPVTCLHGETGFGMFGSTAWKKSEKLYTNRSRQTFRSPSLFGR